MAEVSDEGRQEVAERILSFGKLKFYDPENTQRRFYVTVAPRLAENARDGGVVARLLAPKLEHDPVRRIWTALYYLTLKGETPELEKYFPSLERADFDVTADPGPGWLALRQVLEAKESEIASLMDLPIQYHAPFRAAPLTAALLGFREQTDLPFRLLEMGSSGGFLLRPDRYGYFADGQWYGDPDSPLKIDPAWSGANFEPKDLNITSRAGCDLRPLNPRNPESRIQLMASIIPTPIVAGQLHAAFKVALDQDGPPVTVRKESADRWVTRKLAQARDGVADVLVRSWVDYQLPPHVRGTVHRAVALRGWKATRENPFMEVVLASSSGLLSEYPQVRIWNGDRFENGDCLATSALFRTYTSRDPNMHQPVFDLSRGIVRRHRMKPLPPPLKSSPPPARASGQMLSFGR